MKVLLRELCVVLFLLISLEAQAETFTYEQPPSSSNLGIAEVSSAWDPFFNEPGSQVWDNVSLTSNSDITEIDWWGFNEIGTADPNFSVTLYTNVNGVPGDPISQLSGSFSVVGSLNVPSVPGGLVYEYSFLPTTPFPIDANSTYWLSIYNEESASFWGWQIADDPTYEGAIQTDYAYDWSNPVNDVAFRVVGESAPVTVPDGDCSALTLLASGFVGLLVIPKVMNSRNHTKAL